MAASPSSPAPAKKESWFVKMVHAAGGYFKGFFSFLLGSNEAQQFENAIVSFVKTDVGTLALDAVQYAGTLTNLSTSAQRDAAVQKLKTDLQAAGKDVSQVATSTLNLLIEVAYTYVKGSVANLPDALGK